MFHVDFSYALNSLIFFLQFSLDQKISRGLLKKKKKTSNVAKFLKPYFFYQNFEQYKYFNSSRIYLFLQQLFTQISFSIFNRYIHTFSPVKKHNHNYDTILKQTTGKKSSVKNLPDRLDDEFLQFTSPHKQMMIQSNFQMCKLHKDNDI